MALAFIITLDKDLPELADYTKGASGKAVAREADRLDMAARSKGVTGLTGLLSENPAVLAEQMRAEGFDPGKMRLPLEQWFAPAEGLKSVRGIAEYVSAKLNDFKQPNPILRDLKAAETLLLAAEAAGAKFHFTKVDLPSKK